MYNHPLKPDEIYHYGIKRRSGRYPWGSGDRPYQRTTFDQRKEEAKRNISGDPSVKGLNIYPELIRDAKFYEDLKHDRLIKKGSFAFRVSSAKNEKEEGQTFVSFDGDSFDMYKELLGSGYDTVISKYVVKKDLKIPSNSKMASTLIECMMENQDVFKRSIDEYNSRVRIPEKVKNKIISNPNETLVNMYSSFLKGTSKTSGELGDKVHKKLKEEGYDAVPDLNDVSIHMPTALFVFDRSSSLEKKSQWEYWDDDADDDYTFKYEVEYID